MNFLEVVFAILILSLTGFYSFKKKLLTNFGIILSLFFGALVFFFGGIKALFVLLVVYAMAQFSGKIVKNQIRKKHDIRGIENVLGNVGPATALLLAGFPVGFYGSVASAASDTIASEIGLLSKKRPKLITNFKEVEYGTNGAISFLGTLFSFFAALLIALIVFVAEKNLLFSFSIMVSGFGGMLFDSLLGATLQKKGMLDNNSVNFAANHSRHFLRLFLLFFESLFSNSLI